MRFVNRVLLQGYLEIEQVGDVVLDAASGLSAPIVRGWLWGDPVGLMRHRLIVADQAATALLDILRKTQPIGSVAMVVLGERQVEIACLDGKPFVSLEGTLVDGIVNVKWITVLSLPEISLLRLLTDPRLRDVVYAWGALSEGERVQIARTACASLGLAASGRASPDGDTRGGLSSTPPTDGRDAPRLQGAGRRVRPKP